MTPQIKAWLFVICTALFTGCGVAAAAAQGGCKTSWAIVSGVGAGAGAVLHALMQSPNQPQQPSTENQTKP